MIDIPKNEWKKVFRKDIEEKFIASQKEFQQYKKTGKIVYLQQAGNKLFSVVENWLMLQYGVRVRSYQELRKVVRNDRNNRLLLSKVAQLHYFFYQNKVMGEPEEYEDLFEEAYRIMKNRLKK